MNSPKWFSFLFVILMLAAQSSAGVLPPIKSLEVDEEIKKFPTISLNEAIESEYTGLEKLSEKEQDRLLAQAKRYAKFRRGDKVPFLNSCEKSPAKDPFCSLEEMRKELVVKKRSTGAPNSGRHEKPFIVEAIKNKNYVELQKFSLQGIISAVSSFQDINKLKPVIESVLEAKECVSSNLLLALGGRTEDEFPAAEYITKSIQLYEKSSRCGQDVAAMRARYRLALLNISQGKCDGVDGILAPVETHAEVSFLNSRAKYWRYHCAEKTKNTELAKKLESELIRDYPLSFHVLTLPNFEKQMETAMEQSNKWSRVQVRSFSSPRLSAVIEAIEALVQVNETHVAGDILDTFSNELGSLEAETQLYLALLMSKTGQGIQKFKLMTNMYRSFPRMLSQQTLKLFFPMWKYDILKASEKVVDPFLITSLVRQESAFNERAYSRVGAVGLMQVMPRTARSIASVSKKKLWDPKTNVQVGTKYFVHRLKQLDGEVELTLASYNAGISKVEEWMKRYPTENRLLFVDLIPYRETREYVATILRNYYWYTRLYTKDSIPARLSQNREVVIKIPTLDPSTSSQVLEAN